MIEIDASDQEKQAGRLTPEHLAAAKRALQSDGVVVVNDIVDTGHLDVLRERMTADAEAIRRRKNVPTQFTAGNIQQDPPPLMGFLFRDILANDIIIQVTRSILGPGMTNDFYSGNTNLPGSQPQPVHADSGQLWPNLAVAHPASRLVVNIPVVAMDERNGSTEIWPGTHLDTGCYVQRNDIKIDPADLEARRGIVPPLQPAVRAGSVLIRDIRTWHRGMPNRADRPRPMIAMIHNVSWWPTSTLVFEDGAQAILDHPDLHTPAKFVAGPIDYLNRNEEYDVQAPST